MAWCENPNCKKTGLSKNDVEFDESVQKVLCTGCYCLAHPGWMPPTDYVVAAPVFPRSDEGPEFSYEISLTSDKGFVAKVGMGDLSIGFHAPIEEIHKLFSRNPDVVGG